MNKRQKLVQQQFLDNEKGVIKRLNQVYSQSLKDITAKSQKLYDEIEELTSAYDDVEDEAEKAVLKSRIQSKVYQKQYQDGLKKQVSDILDKMNEEQFETVSDYLNKCYEEGFVGTLYDLQGQGIPLAFPLDQEAMVRAVQTDSKISKGLYNHLGENVDMLKKHITAQVSRGISTGMTFNQIAKQLSMKMMGTYTNPKGSLAYAKRIARTEGHRIQCQATMDACHNAKDRGADVVKQWDSTLDAKTRDSHAMVDGEYKELDEKFSNGLMFPGDPSGGAAEVVNCRCALLQKGRWLLGAGFTRMNNFTKQLETFDSPEDYNEFKKGFFSKENRQYMNYVQDMENKYKTRDFAKILDKMDDREYNHYSKLLEGNPMFNKKADLKADAEYQDRIRARREAWKQKKTTAQQTVLPDFDAMDRKQLENYASNSLQTTFEGFKGANTEYIKDAVRVIDEFERKLGKTTLEGLSVKFGGVPQGVFAKYDDKTKTLLVKKTGSKAAFEEKLKNDNVRSRRKLGKDYHATETYSGTLWHEIGHAVDMDTGEALSKRLSNDKELEKKSIKISAYAGTMQNIRVSKRSEAWAENFSAYMEGTNKDAVPSEIAEMIEGYFKKKRKSTLH